MKTLKKILLVLLVLVAIPFVVALFVKKDYGMQREVQIDRPVAEVFAYIKLLKNQDNFSKWASMDPAMKKSFRGTDGTVGFVSAWESTNPDVGRGEQEITAIVEGQRIDYTLRFLEPFESTDKAYILTEAVAEGQTRVVWGFDGHMAYPMNLMLLLMDFEQMLGSDFEQGLATLKTLLEQQPVQ